MGYVRFLFAIMICVANMIIYGLKVNISTAIIGMVKASVSTDNSSKAIACPEYDTVNEGPEFNGPYEWTSTEQGFVVSIYFAGYLIGMFPCGFFADRFNAKWVLLVCVFCNALFTLLVPVAAASLTALYTLRFFTGLISAANLPVVNVLVGQWVVYEEKSTWVGIIYAGTSLGTVVSIFSSGLIMKDLGWEAVFYIHGALPLIWCIIFFFFFEDCPEKQKYISEEERHKLLTTYGHRDPTSSKKNVPWKAIFMSVPFWALVFTNTLGNFCWYFLLTQLPLYMSQMLRFNIKANSTISCLPYLVNAFTNTFLGRLLDYGRKKGYWSQTVGRKIAVGISTIPASIFLIVIMYIQCDRNTASFLLCLSIVISGAIFVGHLINQNDLSPNYAGILMGITNTPGTISAFILPTLVGYLNEKEHTFEGWRYVFWLNVVTNILAFLIFVIFGSGEIQSWNNQEEAAIKMEDRRSTAHKSETKSLMQK